MICIRKVKKITAYHVSAGYTPLIVIIQVTEISSPNFSYIDKLIEEYGDHPRSLTEIHFLWTEKLLILKVTNFYLLEININITLKILLNLFTFPNSYYSDRGWHSNQVMLNPLAQNQAFSTI